MVVYRNWSKRVTITVICQLLFSCRNKNRKSIYKNEDKLMVNWLNQSWNRQNCFSICLFFIPQVFSSTKWDLFIQPVILSINVLFISQIILGLQLFSGLWLNPGVVCSHSLLLTNAILYRSHFLTNSGNANLFWAQQNVNQDW